jgi:type II secretory pathway component PulM
MRMALVVIIAVAWVVILVPGFLRRRSASDATDSITHFHQQLRVLEHSAPTPIVAPAYRLRVEGDSGAESQSAGDPPTLTVVGARDLPRPALAFLAEDPPVMPVIPASPAGAPSDQPGSLARAASWPDFGHRSVSTSRRVTRQRRRDTLGVLILVFLVSFMIGFVPGASVAWAATGIVGVALVGYVVLLVHLRRRAEEREHKLHYIRQPATRLDEYARESGTSLDSKRAGMVAAR